MRRSEDGGAGGVSSAWEEGWVRRMIGPAKGRVVGRGTGWLRSGWLSIGPCKCLGVNIVDGNADRVRVVEGTIRWSQSTLASKWMCESQGLDCLHSRRNLSMMHQQ